MHRGAGESCATETETEASILRPAVGTLMFCQHFLRLVHPLQPLHSALEPIFLGAFWRSRALRVRGVVPSESGGSCPPCQGGRAHRGPYPQ